AHIEVALAANEARSGEIALARRRIRKWPVRTTGDVALDRWRDMVRMDVAILEGDNDEAEPLVARVLRFAERTNAPLLVCHLRFCAVLVAHPSMFAAALRAYRHDVHRLQIPYHV